VGELAVEFDPYDGLVPSFGIGFSRRKNKKPSKRNRRLNYQAERARTEMEVGGCIRVVKGLMGMAVNGCYI